MIRPDEKTQEMRHDDAEEADGAAHRHGGAGQERHRDDGRALEDLHRNAEMTGFRFAQRQRVEAAGESEAEQQPDGDEGRRGDDLGICKDDDRAGPSEEGGRKIVPCS